MSALTNFIISSIISFFGTLSPDLANETRLSDLHINLFPTEFKNCESAKKDSDKSRAFKCYELSSDNQF